MDGYRLWARAQWRRQGVAIVALAAIFALSSGVALAAVAGARRTESAFDRFREAVHDPDIVVSGFGDGPPVDLDPDSVDEVVALDGVISATAFSAMGVGPVAFPSFFSVALVESGGEPGRTVIVEGRAPDLSVPHEILVNEAMRDVLGVDMGDEITLVSLTPEQWERFDEVDRPEGPTVEVTVVGVNRDVEAISDAPDPFVVLTPAFWSTYRDEIGHCDCFVGVATEPGAAARVSEQLRDIYGERPSVEPPEDYGKRVDDTVGLQRNTLLLIAATAVVAGLIVTAQAASRLGAAAATDDAVWRAAGMTSRQLKLARSLAQGPAIIAGAVASIGVAYLLSPLMPVGLARRAEPDPGLRADWLVYGAGAAAAVVVGGAVVTAAASRRRSGGRTAAQPWRYARPMAAALGPVAGFGARAVSRTGRGGTAGVALGVAGLVAAFTFQTSIDHLLETPALYGADYDALVFLPERELDRFRDRVVADRDAEAVAELWEESEEGNETEVEVSGPRGSTGVNPSAFVAVSGSIGPVMVEGRAPIGPDEAAPGRAVIERLGAGIGDELTVDGLHGPVSMQVVGVAIQASEDVVDEGFWVSVDGLERLVEPARGAVAVRLAEHAELDQVLEAGEDIDPSRPPSEVGNLGQLGRLPLWTGVVLAVLGVAALLHALLVAERRSRRELAIHRAVGFTRRQAWLAVMSAGALAAIAGALVGAVSGWIAGRWLHASLVRAVGAVVDTVLPPSVTLIVAGAVGLALLVSGYAGFQARRRSVAETLRAE